MECDGVHILSHQGFGRLSLSLCSKFPYELVLAGEHGMPVTKMLSTVGVALCDCVCLDTAFDN